jgi:hypothetical protein
MIIQFGRQYLLANLIRHKLRNHNRIVQFNTFSPRIDVKTVLVKESLVVNHWLAGFIQADGSFQIKLTPKLGKTPYRTHGHSNRSKPIHF